MMPSTTPTPRIARVSTTNAQAPSIGIHSKRTGRNTASAASTDAVNATLVILPQ